MPLGGYANRIAHADLGRRTVEYRLTPLGLSLAAAVNVIKAWTYEHAEELGQARDRYDQAAALAR